jgi:hypothetical protein
MNPDASIDSMISKMGITQEKVTEVATLAEPTEGVTNIDELVDTQISALLTRPSINGTEAKLVRTLLEYKLGNES